MNKQVRAAVLTAAIAAGFVSPARASEPSGTDQIEALREQLLEQRAQIEQLRRQLDEQQRMLDSLTQTSARTVAPPPAASVASLREAETRNRISVDALAVIPENDASTLGGFQFSGDFRFRADVQARSGNSVAPPLQNVRSRYRVRLNVDKELDSRFRFHLQLSTGPYSNAITNDQDMGGMVAKHPFSISEAYVDFHPNSTIALRGGRMEEVFADNMRFLWDDDVRFNGFQQIVKAPLGDNALGLTALELRAGEYILSNPAVYVLSPNSPFVSASFQPGQKVRDSNLFHPGFILKGRLSPGWSHQIMGSAQLYRNPNQIQLASTASGFPVLVNNTVGLVLAGPPGGTGNATTTPGGAIYSAPNFQIAHVGYRLERKGLRIGGRELPAFLDFQASRNFGASGLRDAVMASANLGSVQKAGDVRALYQFALKDANSMISQFTDDDLGTGSGVNIAVHAMRFDIGLARFLQLQNLFFMQHQRRPSDPASRFFVPLQRGANATFRYLGQLAFSF